MAKVRHNIATILSSFNGATFAGIDYVGVQKVNKTQPNDAYVKGNKDKIPAKIPNPHFEQITKTSSIHTMIGADYETMVKKHLAEQRIEEMKTVDELREAGQENAAKAIEDNMADPNDFVKGERKWGKHNANFSSIIEHNDNHYLAVIARSAKDTTYLYEGQQIEKDDIIGMPKSKPSSDSQGGANKKVTYRTIGLESITEIRIGGKTFIGEFYFEE
ncbi:MAG: hypothetical protein JXR12_06660 [Neptunomonas phycophila]|uniref:hypothetical protein n=1 Tax=Neptunomonas phycophila TaxID=1572645 RepID=UPI003B8E13D0